MAKLVDALDLGSSAAMCESSSLSGPTKTKREPFQVLFLFWWFVKVEFHICCLYPKSSVLINIVIGTIAKQSWACGTLPNEMIKYHFVRGAVDALDLVEKFCISTNLICFYDKIIFIILDGICNSLRLFFRL